MSQIAWTGWLVCSHNMVSVSCKESVIVQAALKGHLLPFVLAL